ncbi:MAG: undecaprenyl-diphosphate phosphatase [Bradymonadaceae bacterium]
MDLIDAIVLGLVQGATEFLPISSSGHLVLGQYLLGLDQPELLFDIVLHVGTLLAVVGFYRRDLGILIDGIWRGIGELVGSRSVRKALEPDGARLAVLIAVACIPTGILGVLVDEFLPIERGTVTAVVFVCGALLVNGLVLFAGRLVRDRDPEERSGPLTLWNVSLAVALAVGTAQGLAVIPGISRSGMTIISALFLGIWRDQAARFSFLMSIPAILGALVLKFDPTVFSGPAVGPHLLTYGLGALAAGLSGFAAIYWLVRLIERAQFHHFSWYCWLVGGAGLAFLLL